MEKKTSKHCGGEFPELNEYSSVQINAEEVRDVVKKLECQLKYGRVFFPEDAPCGMKCETLLKNAAAGIADLSVSGTSFTAKDMTLYAEDDKPKEVTVAEEDFIALLDSTKKGLFGNLAKKECAEGALVTKKGILTYQVGDDKKPHRSGFVTWPSIAVSPDRGYSTALFYDRSSYKFPRGRPVWLYLLYVSTKGCEDMLHEFVMHLTYIARGKGAEFDYDDIRPEGAGDFDEAEGAGDFDEAEGAGDFDESEGAGDADE